MADVKVFSEMTIAEKFGVIAGMVEDAEMKAFLADRAEKATRKSGDKKPSKVQVEMAEVIVPLVYEALKDFENGATVGELIKTPALAEFVTAEGNSLTSPKITAALKKLGDKVVNVKDGKKSLYKIA